MTPSTARKLNLTAIAIGALGVLLWVGVTVAMLAWPTPPSPLSMDDLAAISARTGILGRIGLAGFVLIQVSCSLSAIVSPRVGRRSLIVGLVLVWVGMLGFLGMLPGLWIWYWAPLIAGNIIMTNIIPRAHRWLYGEEKAKQVG